MKNIKFFTAFLIIFSVYDTFAQQQTEQEKRQEQLEGDMRENGERGWANEISLGVDAVSNLLINPAVGAGESRLGFTGSAELDLRYREGLFSWNTLLSISHGIQKNGTGLTEVVVHDTSPNEAELMEEDLEDTLNVKVPFQKNIDNIWLNSRASLRTSYFSQFYYTADLSFTSQLTPSYEDNYLSDITRAGYSVSKFLAPATLQLATGMEYRPNDFLSFFLTPASVKFMLVLDDNIADDLARDRDDNVLGTIHGNPYTDTGMMDMEGNPIYIFKNTDIQFGATFRVTYQNEINKNIALNSNLLLFSNYLEQPYNIDINWRNEISITIFKDLKFSLLSFLTYDHDIFVQRTDNTRLDGINGFGRNISYTQQFLLKYTLTLD